MLLICVGFTIIATLQIMQVTSIGLLYVLCLLISFATCCFDIQNFNFTLEFANADKMPTYTALRASVMVLVRFFMLLLVSGLVVESFSPRVLYYY